MRVALAQINPLIGDIAGIKQQITTAAAEALEGGAELVVFPELATIGYPPRDILSRKRVVLEQWDMVHALAKELPLPAIIGCVEPLYDEDASPPLANALVACADGAVVATYRKRLLPVYDVFDEQRYFSPGDDPVIIDIAGHKIGLTICEDIWTHNFSGVRYGQDPVGDLIGKCDLVVNSSASPYHAKKPAMRHQVVRSVAARVGCPVVYVNQVGGNDELLFDGDSICVAADGRYHQHVPRWHSAVAIADTDIAIPAPAAIDPLTDLEQALVLGIRDYCHKTGQKSVVLGLSGGIDSALTAALAVHALGADAVTGLLMPGPYSSAGSITDAEATADLLGIQRFTCSINDGFTATMAAMGPAFADLPANVAEENIQSRLRGTLVMAYANKHNAMALTTGNKSELAVGYCTIYGDMNGGLAPLGDLYKTLVFDLSRHCNRDGLRIPVASIEKPPSAELREDQLDSDSLPDYEVLDRILTAYIENDQGVNDLVAAGEDPATVQRIIRLVEINEYKRRQAAPALRVTSKAFGVGRRMPLARRLEV